MSTWDISGPRSFWGVSGAAAAPGLDPAPLLPQVPQGTPHTPEFRFHPSESISWGNSIHNTGHLKSPYNRHIQTQQPKFHEF